MERVPERSDGTSGTESSGALAGANRPLDFFQACFNLPLEREGIERRMLLLQHKSLLLIQHAAVQEPLRRCFGSIVALDLASALTALFHQLDRGTEVVVIQRPGAAIQRVDRFKSCTFSNRS